LESLERATRNHEALLEQHARVMALLKREKEEEFRELREVHA
jgi:hypothetical protein